MAWTGCGEKEPVPPGSTPPPVAPSTTESTGTLSRNDSAEAATTASAFLEAMLRGDSAGIRTLLTPLARKKVEENGIPFAPVSSKSAGFTIDKTVSKGEIGAYVHTTLSDVNDRGQKESVEIVWIVARCEEGWRVAGAAVMLFEGQEKAVINFEDPPAALQAIDEAVKRRKEAEHIKQARFDDGPTR